MFSVWMIQSFKGIACVLSKKGTPFVFTVLKYLSSFLSGKPVMIVIEYMENGALDAFLRVSTKMKTYINIFKVTYIVY